MKKVCTDSDRKVFWGLITLMSVATLSLGILASMYGKAPAVLARDLQNSSVHFVEFKRVEAHAAMTDSDDLKLLENHRSPLTAASMPKFEDDGLVLDEITLDDDPLEDNERRSRQRDVGKVDFTFPPLPGGTSEATVPLPDVSIQKMTKVDALEGMSLGPEDSEEPWIEHTVAKGEHIGDISRKYGILTATICKANSITDPNKLSEGQVLLIPRTEQNLADVLEEQQYREDAEEEARKTAKPISYHQYIVKNGDSLWTIASAYNLSLDSIFGTNVLKNADTLSPGMVIRIPNQDGLSIKVSQGQTVESIAKKYGVSAQAIRMANSLGAQAEALNGQELFVPGASQTLTAYRNSSNDGGDSKNAPTTVRTVNRSKGKMSWPLRGKINSPFGWRTHPLRRSRSFHTGLDIQGARGTTIHAAKAGQVIFVGWMNGYGRAAVVRHDASCTTLYAHAQKLLVRVGQNVTQGTPVALVGTSGRTTGPHLHFEVRIGNKPVNPIKYLQ